MLPKTSVGEATTVAVVGVGSPVDSAPGFEAALDEVGAAAVLPSACPLTLEATPPAITYVSPLVVTVET